jgi:hypothetical protein
MATRAAHYDRGLDCHAEPRPELAYSIAVPAVALVLSIFLMPETRGMRIWGDP